MNSIQLPPNWDDLVRKSRELLTEDRFKLAKTWLFSEADSGDNASIPQPSPILQQARNVGTNAKTTIVPTTTPTINILYSSQARLPVCKGDNVYSSNNDLEYPNMINLAASGLRQSKRIKNMMNPTNPNNVVTAIMAYTSSVKNESPFNGPNSLETNIGILLYFMSSSCSMEIFYITVSAFSQRRLSLIRNKSIKCLKMY